MIKIMTAAAIAGSLVFFSGCKNAGGDPKANLISFFDALGRKDLVTARKLATTESKSMIDMIEMGLKMAKDKNEMDKYDKSRMEFGDAKIVGDRATVPVKDKKSGEMTNFTLKRESGDWKVAFDKSTMMQMGMDKMKEKGVGGLDSLGKGFEELKKINIDSMKDAIEEGMKEGTKKMDSATNLLKELNKK